jgi:hypothetical protein
LKGAGKLELKELIKDVVEEGTDEFAQLETYLQETALLAKKEEVKKSVKKQEPFKRFSSQIPRSAFQLSGDGPVKIQCLREGKFKHPWYGTLKFDQKFFKSMIKNFDADVPNPQIAFDFKHQPDNGAAAWVDKVFIEDRNLMADVNLTEKGRKSIQDGEFKYFSIEYTDDYVEYEFKEVLGENGEKIEVENKIPHGPTMLGGGLTNRPFIKGMAPVALSEGGEVIEFEE